MKKTDPAAGLTDVAALMAERQQYEVWLASLDARRETTPERVFERVHADYTSRLERVLDQLSRHRAELEERLAALTTRIASLESDEQVRRDERAELELRAHVGELTPEAFETAAAECDRAIDQATAARATTAEEAERTRAFLAAATRAPTPPSEPAVAPLAAPAAPPAAPAPARLTPSFDELAFLNTVVGAEGAGPTERAPVSADPAPAAAAAPADEVPPSPRRSSKPTWISDEPFQPADPSRDVEIIREDDESPLAANVTGNQPIVLRPSQPVEHSKTLKCSECGAMNYPTEWYCERCGAELAAL